MKFALIAILGLAGSIATAGGLDAAQYNYGDEAYFPVAATSCVNGSKQYFVESVNGLDKYINVSRTCVDGVYYPRTSTKVQPCKNGAVAFWTASNKINDRQATAEYVCVAGKYIAR